MTESKFGGVPVRQKGSKFGGEPVPPEVNPIEGFFQGFNIGLGDLLAAPVDIAGIVTDPLAEAVGLPKRRSARETVRQFQKDIGTTTVTDISQLPEDARIAARGGEVVGASVPFIAAPLALAGTSVEGGIFAPILETARQAPGTFALAEAGGAMGAAQGGMLAEIFAPGNETVRFFAETAGGFMNPTALASRAVRGTKNQIFKTIKSFTRSGRKSRAADIVQDIVAQTGENPEKLVSILRSAEEKGIVLTAGQKTGSPALLALEAKLAKSSPAFAGEKEKMVDESLGQLRKLVDNLTASGDPDALAVAAKLRQKYFDDLLERRLRNAETAALEARAKLYEPGSKADPSIEARKVLSDALNEARGVEKSLWQKIPQDIAASTEGLNAARTNVEARLLEEETVPFAKTLERMADGATTGDLVKLRNRALEAARDSAAKGDYSKASQYNVIADGALDDLTRLELPSIQNAREYSAALNDRFTRTFAGDALSRSGTGAPRIAPELMLERAFGGGGTRGELRFRQLEEAAGFPDGSAFAPKMMSEQERFLRMAADETLENGIVNPSRLEDFLSRNEELLSRFPALRNQLSDAQSAAEAFRNTEQAVKTASKAIQQKAAFSHLIGREDPVSAIGDILRGKNPIRDFRQLSRMARGAGEGATEGLKSSTIDYAMRQATGANSFSFAKMKEILAARPGRRKPSLIEMMKSNNVMKADEAIRLNKLLNRATDIEKALTSKSQLDKLIDEPDAFLDLALRIAGANIGGHTVLARTSGAPLVAAGATSRFFRNTFEKIPATRAKDVLMEAAKNPEFMASLLERPKTMKQARQLERQINAFLIGAGLTSEEE